MGDGAPERWLCLKDLPVCLWAVSPWGNHSETWFLHLQNKINHWIHSAFPQVTEEGSHVSSLCLQREIKSFEPMQEGDLNQCP